MTTSNTPRQGRGRPSLTDEQIAKTRAHISNCALQLFQAEGFEAVSMRRLAQEAGITTMTLYKYFDSKIVILRTLWAAVFADLFDELERIAAKEPDALARLHAICAGYVAFWLENTPHYFMVFMSKDIKQSDVRDFIGDVQTLQRFGLFRVCLKEVLPSDTSDALLEVKSENLLCYLNGVAHNLITISSYPWSDYKVLLQDGVGGIIAWHDHKT